MNAHHDAGFLTLLWQHGVGGLQAMNQDGEWIERAPFYEAVALTGDGVFDTLKSISKLVLKSLG